MVNIPKEIIDFCELFKCRKYNIFLFNRCVNELLLDKRVYMYNIATNASYEEIKDIIKYNDCRIINTDTAEVIKECFIKYRGYTIHVKSYCDDLNRTIGVFDVSEDPTRAFFYKQGFTIDSMGLNPFTGDVIDYYGGMKDLNNKVIRINEDDYQMFKRFPMLLLQMYSLAVELDFRVDDNMEENVKKYFLMLKDLDGQLAFYELCKIVSKDPQMFDRMNRMGAMKYLIPELATLYKMKDRRIYYHGSLGAEITYLCSLSKATFQNRWAILLCKFDQEMILDILNRFKIGEGNIKRILNIINNKDVYFRNEYDVVKFVANNGVVELNNLLDYKEAMANASDLSISNALKESLRKEKENVKNIIYKVKDINQAKREKYA